MAQTTVKYFSNEVDGKVYEKIVASDSKPYAVAVAAQQFLREGARVTINSNFDIRIDGQSGRRFDATSLSYWLRRTPEGQLALERESMQPLLAALED
jgi:hypothetical protein